MSPHDDGRYAAICCNTIRGFLQGHARASASGRTAILLTRNDWTNIPALQASFGAFEVLSDVADDPRLLPFSPTLLDPADSATMPAAAQWPDKLSILFTSGSTGQPKAIVKYSSEILGEQASLAQALPGANASQNFISTVPLEHMFGYTFGFCRPMLMGGQIGERRLVFPQDLKSACEKSSRPVWIATTPTHIRAYADLGIRFENVAGVICATAPLSQALARRGAESFGVSITEIYGSTETGAMALRTRHATEQTEPVWECLPGVRVAADEQGQGHCHAAHLLQAVPLNDLIHRVPGGFQISGRTGDLVKVAGKRQSLCGLNTVLSQIDGVRDGAYFFPSTAEEDVAATLRPQVFVVMEAGYSTSHVIPHLRGKIDDVFIPREIFQVSSLPRLESGKLRDSDLAALALSARIQHAHLETKETPCSR
jgi:acyl-coenzyme A synthetase/AMP-(fatty) acid ligase